MSETGASHSHFRSIRFKIVLAVGALAVSAVVAGVFGTRTVVQEILYRELDVHGNALGLEACTGHVRLARQRFVGVLVRRYPVIIGQLLHVVLTLKTKFCVSR